MFKLGTIYFYLTEGCNLACRHCWIEPKFNGGTVLDLALFKSIIQEAKALGLSGVKLTGGEPLLHPNINEILDFIKNEDLHLTVETNGLLAAPELSQKLKSCKKAFVSVSLDGADAETHEWIRGVSGCFDKTIKGIKNLVRAGFKPQIIMTIMQRNKDQIEPMVRLAESLGAGSVKFNITQPTARGEQMHKTGETLSIEDLIEIGIWVENTLSNTTNLRLHYSHPMAFRPLGKMFGEEKIGCGTCGILSIIGVLANGSYALCGIGKTVPEFIFGNAAKDRLKDVWNNTPILQEIREGLPDRLEGNCSECVMKRRCRGSCIAQNYYSTKNLWAPFWYCAQAHERGLFPESRKVLKVT